MNNNRVRLWLDKKGSDGFGQILCPDSPYNDTTDIYIKVPFGPKMYFVYYRYLESEKTKFLSDPR
jgi:hypothetical protein